MSPVVLHLTRILSKLTTFYVWGSKQEFLVKEIVHPKINVHLSLSIDQCVTFLDCSTCSTFEQVVTSDFSCIGLTATIGLPVEY